jgi:NADH:ubiquinone oxidoreductase subunit 4 (subunit M)
LAFMVLLQVSVALIEITFNRKHTERSSYFSVIQASLLILYFGLLTYDMFLGPVCLHHGPHFSPGEFVRYGFGIYPVSIVLVVLSAFLIWKENNEFRTPK